MWPDSDADYADVYDGRDPTAGKKFCRVEASSQNTRHISLGQGVPFDIGIYVNGKDAAVETTVVFTPLDF
jgi:endoglucanase Acf2